MLRTEAQREGLRRTEEGKKKMREEREKKEKEEVKKMKKERKKRNENGLTLDGYL